MPSRLVAAQLPPAHLGPVLRSVWDAGDAVLPLPMDAPAEVVASTLATVRPAALITVRTGAATGPTTTTDLPAPRPLPDDVDVALVVATSGSTGAPKGVVLSRPAVRASTSASLARLGAQAGDAWVLALPTHHVAGLQVVLRAWATGGEPVVAADAGDPRAIAAAIDVAAGDGRPVHVSLVPTQLRRLLADRDRVVTAALAHVGTVLLGGAGAPADLLADAAARGLEVVVSYGMTETCGGCVYDGRPFDDVEVALRPADGRIRLRGPVLSSGYLGDPAATAGAFDADGWFTTGDVGHLDDRGRLVVDGRADDVIVSGGENVPAGAVRDALLGHPLVADAAVVGRPDPEWGTRVVALVVPAPTGAAGASTTPATLRAHLRDRLPPAHLPREVRLVAALPRDAMGKVTAATVARLLGEPAPPPGDAGLTPRAARP